SGEERTGALADPVHRLRAVAAPVVGFRRGRAATAVLAGAALGGGAVAGGAHRSAPPGTAQPPRRATRLWSEGAHHPGTESPGTAPEVQPVHGAAGRLGRVAAALYGSAGRAHWSAGGEPGPDADRGGDRVFREHAGDALAGAERVEL